jgi:hypothetical protein
MIKPKPCSYTTTVKKSNKNPTRAQQEHGKSRNTTTRSAARKDKETQDECAFLFSKESFSLRLPLSPFLLFLSPLLSPLSPLLPLLPPPPPRLSYPRVPIDFLPFDCLDGRCWCCRSGTNGKHAWRRSLHHGHVGTNAPDDVVKQEMCQTDGFIQMCQCHTNKRTPTQQRQRVHTPPTTDHLLCPLTNMPIARALPASAAALKCPCATRAFLSMFRTPK